MQPIHRPQPHRAPPTNPGFADAPFGGPLTPQPEATFVGAPLQLAAPALLVEARFGERTLVSRLVRADEPGAFTIGAARGVDAPVNPAWVGEGPAAAALGDPAPYALVTADAGLFTVHLTPAMRAELRTPVQRLALGPDLGRAEAPLALPPDSVLVVPCGEVTFELRATEPAPALPRPWLPARLRDEGRYTIAVALAMLLLLAIVRAVPSDPRALSLDDIAANHRLDRTVLIPIEVPPPPVESTVGSNAPGGSSAPAAPKPAGKAGATKAPDVDARMSTKGNARPEDARVAAARVRSSGLLLALEGARTGALADVLSNESALGAEKDDVIGHLVGTVVGISGGGAGGLSAIGSGAGGGGTNEAMLGSIGLGTLGRFGSGTGAGRTYGAGAGQLGRHVARVPEVIPSIASVRGSLDKEIIRRIVRRHLNEVRFCYDEALAGHPSLAGRVVVQFTIANTGRVIASLIGSSSLGVASVDACIANAVKRWEFPAPAGGGLVMVSYPFQLSPAGG
jgi:TonB family protein